GLKARAEAIFHEIYFVRWAIGGEDDLCRLFHEGVEGVKKLLLNRVFAGDELDVIEEEDVGVSIFLFEVEGGLGFNGVDDLIGEFLAGAVNDAGLGVLMENIVAD